MYGSSMFDHFLEFTHLSISGMDCLNYFYWSKVTIGLYFVCFTMYIQGPGSRLAYVYSGKCLCFICISFFLSLCLFPLSSNVNKSILHPFLFILQSRPFLVIKCVIFLLLYPKKKNLNPSFALFPFWSLYWLLCFYWSELTGAGRLSASWYHILAHSSFCKE